MINLKREWIIEPHLGHGSGGARLVICAPDYENRVAVISLNGVAKGDQAVALEYAQLSSICTQLVDCM